MHFTLIRCKNKYATGLALHFWLSILYESSRNVFFWKMVFFHCSFVLYKEEPCSSIFISAVFICNRVLKENFLHVTCKIHILPVLKWNLICCDHLVPLWFNIKEYAFLLKKIDHINMLSIKLNAKTNMRLVSHYPFYLLYLYESSRNVFLCKSCSFIVLIS